MRLGPVQTRTFQPGVVVRLSQSGSLQASDPPGTYLVTRRVGDFPDAVVAASEPVVVTKQASGEAAVRTAEPEVTAGASKAPPTEPALHAAYPNPSGGAATVRYDVSVAGPVRLVVYDLLGRAVAGLVDGETEAGRYTATLDGPWLGAGVYLVRMTMADGFAQTQRVTLTR